MLHLLWPTPMLKCIAPKRLPHKLKYTISTKVHLKYNMFRTTASWYDRKSRKPSKWSEKRYSIFSFFLMFYYFHSFSSRRCYGQKRIINSLYAWINHLKLKSPNLCNQLLTYNVFHFSYLFVQILQTYMSLTSKI